MTLQVSGAIKFSDITGEFGTPPGKNLGAFRVSKTVGQLSNLALDNQTDGTNIQPLIPQSGPIKFSDFYGKRLNIVVNFYSSTVNNTTRKNARTRYDEVNDAGITKIIPTGTTKTKPTAGAGSKIWIHVNQTIGSLKGNRNYVALKTGTWSATATVITHIGTSGKIMGAGGNGGSAGTGSGDGGNGTSGTSALGVQYSTTVVNNGLIFGGRGGGGGGGGSQYVRCGRNQRGCKEGTLYNLRGGGGAGGRGFPAGTGGPAPLLPKHIGYSGDPGTSGTVNLDGSPGSGTFGDGTSSGWDGQSGAGGNIESSGVNGSTEGNNGSSGNGGPGGTRGYAIIVSPGTSVISYSGNARQGSQVSGTVL